METKSLIELCIPEKSAMYGIPAPAEEYDPKKTRYLRISDISDDGVLLNDDMKSVSSTDIEKYILKEGDIVFARTGNSTGRTYYHESKNGDLAYAGFLIKFSLNNKKVNPKYLRYYTVSNHYREWVENFSSGSTRGNLNAKSFSECPIPLPSRKVQDDLVKILSDLDAKIELNNKINAELEAMAKLIYDYWFVQFDFPDENGKPYKSSGGKMVYNEELKREIPEGWEVRNFGSYSSVKSGFAFKSSWWRESGLPVVKIKDINEDYTLNTNELSYVDFDKKKVASRFNSKEGDVIIAMTGATIGKFALIPKHESTLLINQRVGLYDLGDSPFSKLPFLINSMKQEFFRSKIFQVAGGAAQPNISGEQLDDIPLVIPDDKRMNLYNEKLESVYRLISNNQFESNKLSELRDWLLPMLMNGQITVN